MSWRQMAEFQRLWSSHEARYVYNGDKQLSCEARQGYSISHCTDLISVYMQADRNVLKLRNLSTGRFAPALSAEQVIHI